MKFVLRSAMLSLCLFFAGSVLAADAHLMVMDPWVREAPPTAKMLAGYFTIMNHSGKSVQIVGASSDKFEKVELHKSVQEKGMAKMIPQSSVEVAKHGTVKFQPGGLHLMLMYPKAPLKAGDKVDIVLKLKKGDEIKMTAVVKKGGAMGEHSHEHMHHEH